MAPHTPAMIDDTASTILFNYQFTGRDARNLEGLKGLMAEQADEFVEVFYRFIFNFEHAMAFLKNDDIIRLHNVKIKEWFLELFSGTYDQAYFNGLNLVSEAHSRIGLPTHYINASFNCVRRFVLGVLVQQNRLDALDAVEKILDINLDVLTSVYLKEDSRRMVTAIKRIKNALTAGTMVPFYQPIVDNATGRTVKYESLVRIIEADGAIVSPFEFLDVAKQVRLYPDITRAMLTHAFDDYKQLRTPFSVNLSIEDIRTPETHDLIMDLLSQGNIGRCVTFEILESEQIDNYDAMEDFIRRVKAFNAKIAIDDFGSGFSNFDHLTRMPVDYLKIDGSLIRELHNSEQSRMAVESIVDLAGKLGMETIAEFVGSEPVYEAVKAAGITCSQGFYFGRPEPLSHYL